MKTLLSTSKTKDQATKQMKNWFKRNPNRKSIMVKLVDGKIKVNREDILK